MRVREIQTRGGTLTEPAQRFGIQSHIARARVGEFVQALSFLLFSLNRGGGSYIYFDREHNRSAVFFEWYLDRKRQAFFYKVGIEFWLTSDDLTNMNAYVCYGEGSGTYNQEINLDTIELNRVQTQMLEVLGQAENYSELPVKKYFVTRFLKIPFRQEFSDVIRLTQPGITLLAPLFIKRSEAAVSVVFIETDGRTPDEAKMLAETKFATLQVLATLATGQKQESFSIPWRGITFKPWIESIEPLPTMKDVLRVKRSLPPSHFSKLYATALPAIYDMFYKLEGNEQKSVLDAASAYSSGTEQLNKNAAAATVSLFAALAPLKKIENCEGKVVCGKCGKRPPHQKASEAALLAESINQLLGISDTAKQAEVKALIKSLYREYRSAYAHFAIDRRKEVDNASIEIDIDAHIPRQTIENDSLKTFELMTRKSLLAHLGKRTDFPVNFEHFALEADKNFVKSSAHNRFNIPKGVWVGIRV